MRELMPYGYKLINGYVMGDLEVDGYNATQERINKFIDAGLPVPEYELYDSHRRIAIHIN